MAKLKAIGVTADLNGSGAGSRSPMGDRGHLLPPAMGIQGSEVVITKEGDQGSVIRNSVTVGKGESLGSEMKKQNLSAPSTETLEGSQSIPINSDLKMGEWINAVKGKNILKKYEMKIQMEDGVGSVSVPDEVFKDAAPLWEDFLIGRFLDKAPHIGKVHAIVNKIWAQSDKSQMIDVYVINSTTMKFKVSNPVTRNMIVRRAMWNIAEVPVIMAKWSPLIEDIEQETHSIPLWVHLKNVPMDMFSWKGLSFVTSPVGIPARLHPETEQCIYLKIAKVFVKADLSKELPKSMNFTFQGNKTRVEYTYLWLPSKCTHCGKWRHLMRACRRRKEESEVEMEIKVQEVGNVKEKCAEVVESKEVEAAGSETILDADAEDKMDMTTSKNGNIMEVLEKTIVESNKGSEGEKIWMDVSPGKASRTPAVTNKLKFCQVSILSKSRFSVLSLDEEEGEIT